jgi:glycosyltransferase involved in cell wall biosynthesis
MKDKPKDKPETLVLLSPAFPGDESETSWVPTQQVFVKTLRQQFPHLRIIVLAFFYPHQTREYDWHGVTIIPFNASKRTKPGRLLFWRQVWLTLKDIRKESRILGLFSFWCGECALVGHWFGRRYGIPHLCWICGQDARRSNKLVRFIRPAPDELIAMSDFLAEEFYRNHRIHPAHRIYNAIDPDGFPPFPQGKRSIDILGAGSLSRLKQYDILVMVVGSLRPSFPGLRATICGDGEDRQELEQLIKIQGLQRHVTLAGERPHGEVLSLMQQCRIFLHPSSYEGFGVVCLEALYAGARVISFCQPLHRHVPNWFVVGSVEEMAARTRELLLEPDPVYRPVLEHTMQETVNAVMRLFTRSATVQKMSISE